MIDYERSFDFVNRYSLANDMMKNGIGKRFLINQLTILLKPYTLGDKIYTNYGLTQGKSSSADKFSFFVSDMHDCFDEDDNHDFMYHFNLLQLADDTTIIADNLVSITENTRLMICYSRRKYEIDDVIHVKNSYVFIPRNLNVSI